MGRLDLVILGATGFTGRFVVKEVARIAEKEGLCWGIAGRDANKLESLTSSISSVTKPRIIKADINDWKSLQVATESGNILLNCVGPYSLNGEKVISSCLKTQTHHLDVSGEPLYLEKAQLKFFHEALQKKIFVIGSCGFDSIPADLGIASLMQRYPNIKYAETYLSLKVDKTAAFNYATWESLVLGKSNYKQLSDIRKVLLKDLRTISIKRHGFRLINSRFVVPFPGSDRSVIKRTQALLEKYNHVNPIPVETYYTTESASQIFGLAFANLSVSLLSRFTFGKKLLLKHGELFSFNKFSRRPSSVEKLSAASFEMTIHVYLNDGNKVKMKINGPEPGYTSAAICCAQAALTLLKEKDKIAIPGGVLTPGFAFRNTKLVTLLEENGIHFSEVS